MKKAIITIAVIFVMAAIAGGLFFVSQVKSMEENMTNSEKTQEMVKKDTFEPVEYEATYKATLDSDFYMLLLGVDKDADREQSDEFAGDGFRSDTIILAHINTDEKKVALCSMERDLMINLDGYGTCKLNNAYNVGGVVGITKEVENMAGVDISHYAIVDMDGLAAIIDSVGGVEVDVEKPFYDDQMDDGIETAGLQTLNGTKALVYARSRYPWENGDYDRARHQRDVIRSLANKVMDGTNAFQKMSFLNKLSENIATDLTVEQLYELATKMEGIDMDTSMYSMMTPANSTYVDEVSYQVLDEFAWNKMLEAFKNLEDPSEILLNMENATSLESTNKELFDKLRGVDISPTASSKSDAIAWSDVDD